MAVVIKRAERKNVKIKLAITGPSGAGKTMGALLLAKGLREPGGKVLLIDSEKSSGSLYADNKKVGMEFDTIDIEAPYTTDKYLEALVAGQEAGYDVIIIDSITHQWEGEGGLQDKKHALDMRGGNSFTNWRGITKEHEVFKAKILQSPCHIIATIRSKQDYVMNTNDKGKQTPIKVGLAPVQRDGMEYEFSTVFDVAMDHKFTVSKDRTDLFDGRVEAITEKTGNEIRGWLATGATVVPEVSQIPDGVGVIQMVYDADDKLGASEYWSEISANDKKVIWPHLSNGQKAWIKDIANHMPVASDQTATQ